MLLRVELRNVATVKVTMDNKSKAVTAAVSEGIGKSIETLAADVRSHTPVKSGKARDSVYGEMKGALRGVVGYGKETRWYMKIVELSGAVPHPILPRGRRGSKPQRRIGAHARKHGTQDKLDWTTEEFLSTTAAGSWLSLTSQSKRSGGFRLLGGLARALTVGDRLLSWIPMHPGIKSGLHTLATRLDANQGRILETISQTVSYRMASTS